MIEDLASYKLFLTLSIIIVVIIIFILAAFVSPLIHLADSFSKTEISVCVEIILLTFLRQHLSNEWLDRSIL